jgi:hypothetical protein
VSRVTFVAAHGGTARMVEEGRVAFVMMPDVPEAPKREVVLWPQPQPEAKPRPNWGRSWKYVLPEHRARGEAHGQAKLTKRDIIEIRTEYKTGRFTQRDLGIIFGVAESTVHAILHRRIWRHVP